MSSPSEEVTSPDSTRTVPGPADATGEAIDAPPGYEIVRELGRGGMGVVYLARQTALKRLVALKVIRAGTTADARERARFQAEAEAIGQLNHAGIVQIHEVGTHQGQPFLALEYCPGGSLAQRLAARPLTPREAADLVRALAEAVQAAHAANVLHRDLKPSNVLLTDQGQPKVTDFGLAKKFDEPGSTQTGAVVGTPSYMPPEQALGRKDVGPAVDIHALGAILYACLTGRPPFRAATGIDTLWQVVHTEAVPVRQLQPEVPRDLETITHKCLQKESARRYASAQALADDLGRFLRGEPITARPVGAAERALLWCRRNPAVAGLTAAVVLALTAGVVVSALFAIEARRRAGDLEKTTDELRTTVARSLLRPLALQVQLNQPVPPVSDPEIDALEDLAATPDEEVRLRFVAEAVRSARTTRQLSHRAEVAIQAAVGLSPARRDAVERILLDRFDAGGLSTDHETDLALILAAAGPGPTAARRAASVLARAVGRATDIRTVLARARVLGELTARLEPADAAVVSTEAAATLAQAIGQTKEPLAVGALALSLSGIADRLQPKPAAAALVAALDRTTDQQAIRELVRGLGVVTARMAPADARTVNGEAAAVLVRVMAQNADPRAVNPLAWGLGVVAGRMEPRQAADLLAQTMGATTAVAAVETLGRALANNVAERLSPGDAADPAMALAQAMTRTTSPAVQAALAQGLAALAARLDPADGAARASAAAAVLVPALGRTTDPAALAALARGLGALAAWAEPRAATAALGQALSKTMDATARAALAQSLVALAGRLAVKEAVECLLPPFDKATDPAALAVLAQGLGATAARLEPKEAGPVALALIRAFGRTPDRDALVATADALAAATSPLEPRDAAEAGAEAAETLVRLLTRTFDPRAYSAQSEALGQVAGRMEAKEAVAVLVRALLGTVDLSVLETVTARVIAVAPRLARRDAAEVAATLLPAMNKPATPSCLAAQAQALAALAARLEPRDGAARCAATAGLLLPALDTAKDARTAGVLARALAAVAVPMEPDVAAPTLLQAMSKTTTSGALETLARALVTLPVAPPDAARLATEASGVLVSAMGKTTDSNALVPLARGLTAVCAEMPPGEAAKLLVRVMGTTPSPVAREMLARGLAAVGRQLPREEAAVRAAEGAAVLLRALEGATEPVALGALTRGLSALASRLGEAWRAAAASALADALERTADTALPTLARELPAVAAELGPEDATATAAALVRAIGRRADVGPVKPLAQALAGVVARDDFDRRTRAVAAAVGLASPVGVLALDGPSPLPVPALVELLGRPLCVGEARRVVLGQLARRYGRPFADPWEFARFAQERGLSAGSPPATATGSPPRTAP